VLMTNHVHLLVTPNAPDSVVWPGDIPDGCSGT